MNNATRIAPAALAAVMLAPVALAGVTIKAHPSEIEYADFNFDPPSSSDYRYELSNGTTVYMAPSSELPLVTVSFSFKGGSYLEPADKAGLASMTGQMIRRGGTVSMPASEFDEEVDFLAANISASIGSTKSGASVNSLTANFDDSFELFMNMVRTPGFDEAKFEILRNERLELAAHERVAIEHEYACRARSSERVTRASGLGWDMAQPGVVRALPARRDSSPVYSP